MGILRRAMRTGIVLKGIDVLRREASKPENQRKAKELFRQLRDRAGRNKSSA